jgi:hypothetical protein
MIFSNPLIRFIEYHSHDGEDKREGYTLIVISASCYALDDFGVCRDQDSFG